MPVALTSVMSLFKATKQTSVMPTLLSIIILSNIILIFINVVTMAV